MYIADENAFPCLMARGCKVVGPGELVILQQIAGYGIAGLSALGGMQSGGLF